MYQYLVQLQPVKTAQIMQNAFWLTFRSDICKTIKGFLSGVFSAFFFLPVSIFFFFFTLSHFSFCWWTFGRWSTCHQSFTVVAHTDRQGHWSPPAMSHPPFQPSQESVGCTRRDQRGTVLNKRTRCLRGDTTSWWEAALTPELSYSDCSLHTHLCACAVSASAE